MTQLRRPVKGEELDESAERIVNTFKAGLIQSSVPFYVVLFSLVVSLVNVGLSFALLAAKNSRGEKLLSPHSEQGVYPVTLLHAAFLVLYLVLACVFTYQTGFSALGGMVLLKFIFKLFSGSPSKTVDSLDTATLVGSVYFLFAARPAFLTLVVFGLTNNAFFWTGWAMNLGKGMSLQTVGLLVFKGAITLVDLTLFILEGYTSLLHTETFWKGSLHTLANTVKKKSRSGDGSSTKNV
jgi:hypothetical protein